MKKFVIGGALGVLSLLGLVKLADELDKEFDLDCWGRYPDPGFRN